RSSSARSASGSVITKGDERHIGTASSNARQHHEGPALPLTETHPPAYTPVTIGRRTSASRDDRGDPAVEGGHGDQPEGDDELGARPHREVRAGPRTGPD